MKLRMGLKESSPRTWCEGVRCMKRFSQRDAALYIKAMAPENCVLPEHIEKSARRKVSTGPRQKPEEQLQKAVCDYLALLPGVLYWHTPSSTYVGLMTGAKMNYLAKQKRLGVKRGVPDLAMMFRNKHGAFTLAFAELKIAPNKPTDEQLAFMDTANALGAFTAACYDLEDLKGLLKAAGYTSCA